MPNRAFQRAQEQMFNPENGSVVRLQRQVTHLTEENRRLTQENTELKTRNDELTIENQNLNTKIDKIMLAFQKIEEKMDVALADNTKLKEKLDKSEANNAILVKKVEDLTAKVEKKDSVTIDPIVQTVIKQINLNNCKQIEPVKPSSGSSSGCIITTVKAIARPVIWAAKVIF